MLHVPARSALALAVGLLASGCGPSTRNDDTAGGSSSASEGTATDGIEIADEGDGTCRDLVPCAPFEAEVTGACRPLAYVWDGIDCVSVSGCECTGPDCCHLAATREACLVAVMNTCNELPFCLTCEPGTQCFTVCDHVGTSLQSWCEAVTDECGGFCVCEANGYGVADCADAHPSAYTCVIP